MPDSAIQVFIPNDIEPAHLQEMQPGTGIAALHGHTMGTYWTLRWMDNRFHDIETVQDTLQGAFDTVIRQMSHFDRESELSRINRSPAGQPQTISPEFFLVLTEALKLSQLTGGAYNPNLGALSSAFGFGPNPAPSHSNHPPPIPEVLTDPWNHIELDPDQLTLIHHCGQLHLDLSSIAKGYTLDLAAERLQQLGIHHFLLEIGGEFLGRGCKPDAQPWWVDIDTPPHLPRLRFALTHHAIATSGPGKTHIHHLLDPLLARPSTHLLSSVSVLASTCLQADAWATALCVLGPELGFELATQHQITAVFTLPHQHIYTPAARLLLED